jgi:hypothetical protein
MTDYHKQIPIVFYPAELDHLIEGMELLHKKRSKGFKPAIPDDNELVEINDLWSRLVSIRELAWTSD